jgi:hypothetical protein
MMTAHLERTFGQDSWPQRGGEGGGGGVFGGRIGVGPGAGAGDADGVGVAHCTAHCCPSQKVGGGWRCCRWCRCYSQVCRLVPLASHKP